MAYLEKGKKKRVVVLGCGFGGMEFCKHFRAPDTELIVVDRRNHHLFQPLLYQVATGGLSATEIAQPIRSIFHRRGDIAVIMDEAMGIDPDERRVVLRHGILSYDYLVLAAGAKPNYFGNDKWAEHATPLKSLDDAAVIRRQVLYAFERAEMSNDAAEQRRLMTIAIVGGGPTGVELAGAFAELARHVLRKDFRRIDPTQARVVLIEALDRILPTFSPDLSDRAVSHLRGFGVEVRTGSKVMDIREGCVALESDRIEAENIVWTAGVRASHLAARFGEEMDKSGRVRVSSDLSLPNWPEVFAVGDLVHLVDIAGKPVPGLAPAAMQMGRHVARTLKKEVESGASQPPLRSPFKYVDKGMMATVGRKAAVAEIGSLKLHGLTAWLAWLTVHLVTMIGLRNKLAVMLQWFYSYVTYRRGARIIWGHERFLPAAFRKDGLSDLAEAPSEASTNGKHQVTKSG